MRKFTNRRMVYYAKDSRKAIFMQKIYVLDTNILIQTEGKAIYGFDDNIVVIPSVVLEELDNMKNAAGEKGYAVRASIKKIASIQNFKEDLIKEDGAKLSNGGRLLIRSTSANTIGFTTPKEWDMSKPDNIILSVVKSLSIENTSRNLPVILVTNDISLQIKASVFGLHVQGYKNEQIENEETYSGRGVVTISADMMNKLYKDKRIKFKGNCSPEEDSFSKKEWLTIANKYYIVKCHENNSSALAYYKDKELHLIEKDNFTNISGISPKNAGQTFAMHALMKNCDDLPFVILKGCAGSGKTMLALAAGLKQMAEERYDKIIITRSNTLSDEDMGFLPGTLEDKMGPLLAPFYDNLKFLLKIQGEDDEQVSLLLDDMYRRGSIEIVSLAYVRGRSIPNAYIIVDESQNLTVVQAKTIASRLGLGSKLVMLGDPDQIDNGKLDKISNGLVYAAEKFIGSEICAQLTFSEGECIRSPLAMEAISRL